MWPIFFVFSARGILSSNQLPKAAYINNVYQIKVSRLYKTNMINTEYVSMILISFEFLDIFNES